MKKLSTLLASMAIGIILTASVFLPQQAGAQSPEKMSYQAVVRDGSNNLVTSQSVGMQISILQGSTSGTAVYVETHTPSTNANGLVSLEIGNGTVVTGEFATIDWANGPYFIKTETDPEGGSSYSISGTSQLLSVPYALHAKSAETVSGGITESDPVFGAWDKSTGISITESQISDLNHFTTADETDPTVTTYSVGDFAQGGIVFWVDETGQHGLVCAKEDQDGGGGIQWHNGSYTDTEAHGDGICSGEMNTMLIIANQGSNSDNYAAGVCANYTVTEGGITYGDWYLPSIEELNMMYQNKGIIDPTALETGGNAFNSSYYWSSTEYFTNSAWFRDFGGGSQSGGYKDIKARVRAVRAF